MVVVLPFMMNMIESGLAIENMFWCGACKEKRQKWLIPGVQ